MKLMNLLMPVAVVLALAQPSAGADPAGGAAQAAALDVFLRTIAEEANPTAITVAYGRGTALLPKSVKLHEAYVRRMIQLGQLALAYQPAQVLTKLEPQNGLAWAVVAHMHAGRDEYEQALTAVVNAAALSRHEPFVLDVAGQMVAWFDHKADKEKIDPAVCRSLAKIREDLAKQKPFTQAYDAAKAFFDEQAAREAEPDKVFVPDHLKQDLQAAGDRERRVRELIEELDRRRERDLATPIYTEPATVHVEHHYHTPYSYYPYGAFGFYYYPRIIFGRGLYYHTRPVGFGRLIVTPYDQVRRYGTLVVSPYQVGLIFGYEGNKWRLHGSVRTRGGSRPPVVVERRLPVADRPRPSSSTVRPPRRPRPVVATPRLATPRTSSEGLRTIQRSSPRVEQPQVRRSRTRFIAGRSAGLSSDAAGVRSRLVTRSLGTFRQRRPELRRSSRPVRPSLELRGAGRDGSVRRR